MAPGRSRCSGRGHVVARRLAAAAVLVLASEAVAQTRPPVRPRLVVAISVDQLRADYIDRFRPFFGPGGFNLFLERGARFTQARYRHATTSTCPGHAVILTGSYADVNGIVANDWYDIADRPSNVLRRGPTVTLVGSTWAGPLSAQVVRRHGRRRAQDGDGRPEPGQ